VRESQQPDCTLDRTSNTLRDAGEVASKDAATFVNTLIKNARKLPHELYKSLTWDRGTEMASHQRFTLATDIKVYFCDPQSPWQRGPTKIQMAIAGSILPKGNTTFYLSQQQCERGN